MQTIKVTFNNDDSDYLITGINGTVEEIERYYLGKSFNFGTDCDKMKQCTKVEFLEKE